MPYFWVSFLGGMLILGQKLYFLGLNIFKIPQPKIHILRGSQWCKLKFLKKYQINYIFNCHSRTKKALDLGLFCLKHLLLQGVPRCYIIDCFTIYISKLAISLWRKQKWLDPNTFCPNYSLKHSCGELIKTYKVIFAGETCIFCHVWTWQNKPRNLPRFPLPRYGSFLTNLLTKI